jgi:hypothetical protein
MGTAGHELETINPDDVGAVPLVKHDLATIRGPRLTEGVLRLHRCGVAKRNVAIVRMRIARSFMKTS